MNIANQTQSMIDFQRMSYQVIIIKTEDLLYSMMITEEKVNKNMEIKVKIKEDRVLKDLEESSKSYIKCLFRCPKST